MFDVVTENCADSLPVVSSETWLYVLLIMITELPRSCQETSSELLFVAHRCDGQVLNPQSLLGQVGKNDDAFRLPASLLVHITNKSS